MTCSIDRNSGDGNSGGLVPVRELVFWFVTLCVAVVGARAQQATRVQDASGRLDLPSSKQMGAVPGNPQRLNSLPMSMAVSPDRRYVVTVNAGYGTFESGYMQSLAVMDTQTGKVVDFPDDRTANRGRQTLYSGLAFSADGRHVYASMASLTNPEGGKVTGYRGQATGNRDRKSTRLNSSH